MPNRLDAEIRAISRGDGTCMNKKKRRRITNMKLIVEIPDAVFNRIYRLADYLMNRLECDCAQECTEDCDEDCDGCVGTCLWSAALSVHSFFNALPTSSRLEYDEDAGVHLWSEAVAIESGPLKPSEPYDRMSAEAAGVPWSCHRA
jgi:hypothetical protein